jgi:DNA-directed RNA polymerase subunit RPC12/RpoP
MKETMCPNCNKPAITKNKEVRSQYCIVTCDHCGERITIKEKNEMSKTMRDFLGV